MSWLEAAICWWLPWDSNLRPVGELCLPSPDNMHLWGEGVGALQIEETTTVFFRNLGKKLIKKVTLREIKQL